MIPDHGEGAWPRDQGQPWPQRTPPAEGLHPHGDPRAQQPVGRPDPHRAGGQSHPVAYGQPRTPAGFQVLRQRPPQQPVAPQYGHTRDAETPSRPAPETKPAPDGRSRAPLVVMLVLLVLALAGGAGWWYLRNADDKAEEARQVKILDRQADPRQLTVAEVFPAATIPGGAGSYKVLKTQLSADCRTAAAGAVVQHLVAAGCTQVVRATVESADGAVVVTAGIFNLESRNEALRAATDIKTAIDKGDGRFDGLVAGGGSNTIGRAAANLAWDVRGHYLIYSLTAKPDGSAIAEDDSHADVVRRDVVRNYLGDTIIGKRE